MPTRDVRTLGQVFTPDWVVDKMVRLRRRHGRVLEPSAGAGAFMARLEPDAVGLEIDRRHIGDARVRRADFFAHDVAHRYETIIGNPPYVRQQDIHDATKARLDHGPFDRRTNLYMYFMWKAVDHLVPGGELIFITPRDFLKATSAHQLNERLQAEGAFTYFEELGDRPVFRGVSPNCAIWRWEKGRRTRRIQDGRTFHCQSGQIWFGAPQTGQLLDHFDVRVGAVSGADQIFHSDEFGTVEMAGSKTHATGRGKRMIYNRFHEALVPHKAALLRRRIKAFDESNWWAWGRKYPERRGPRIYVNVKTRQRDPFFTSAVEAFDGSLLALFPRRTDFDLGAAVAKLNAADWERMGFVCGGRYKFTQRSLSAAPIDIG